MSANLFAERAASAAGDLATVPRPLAAWGGNVSSVETRAPLATFSYSSVRLDVRTS